MNEQLDDLNVPFLVVGAEVKGGELCFLQGRLSKSEQKAKGTYLGLSIDICSQTKKSAGQRDAVAGTGDLKERVLLVDTFQAHSPLL